MPAAVAAKGVESPMQRLERYATHSAIWLQDLIFPPTCGNCGCVDSRFCPGCLHKLARAAVVLSPGARELPEELDALIATGKHHRVLRNAVQAFKYDGARELALPLADRLVKALRAVAWQIDAVVPVPLFADREAERGYNQSALLSQRLVSATGIEALSQCLRRLRNTDQQALLSQEERRDNVRDAFAASADARELSILLVDDVITTGSTLGECARALKASGAGAVYGIAISHA